MLSYAETFGYWTLFILVCLALFFGLLSFLGLDGKNIQTDGIIVDISQENYFHRDINYRFLDEERTRFYFTIEFIDTNELLQSKRFSIYRKGYDYPSENLNLTIGDTVPLKYTENRPSNAELLIRLN